MSIELVKGYCFGVVSPLTEIKLSVYTLAFNDKFTFKLAGHYNLRNCYVVVERKL